MKWLAAAALVLSLAAPSPASAGAPAYARLTWANGGTQAAGDAIIKNGAVYLQADAFEMAGLRLQWDKSHQRADFIGYGKSAAVRVGSTAAVLDGNPVRGMPAPFSYQGKLYVSARFFVMTLEGGSMAWDAKNRVFSAGGLHTYAGVSQTYGGRTYSIVKATGELFASGGKHGASVKLADLGSPLYDGVSMSFEPTKGGLLYLTILDNYGEPHLHNHAFTLILKNGSVIRKADVNYWQRYENNVTAYGNHLLLTDGKTLRIVEDGTGNVEQTLDLVKLGGEDDDYFVEGIADDFLLIRPNGSGLLTLVDRQSGASVKLYGKLLSAEGMEYATTNDVPYRGDMLHYVKRNGSALYFEDNGPFAKSNAPLIFSLPIPAGGGAVGADAAKQK
ncbi:stalk domain-containing protein [Paenibacillus glycinis]|nr:stalk domain-containing protein [Paenibacillus glycinis]